MRLAVLGEPVQQLGARGVVGLEGQDLVDQGLDLPLAAHLDRLDHGADDQARLVERRGDRNTVELGPTASAIAIRAAAAPISAPV